MSAPMSITLGTPEVEGYLPLLHVENLNDELQINYFPHAANAFVVSINSQLRSKSNHLSTQMNCNRTKTLNTCAAFPNKLGSINGLK